MKTNTKEYKRRIKEALQGMIDLEGYGEGLENTFSELHKAYMAEVGQWQEERMSKQESTEHWLSGLPSSIGIPFTNSDILDLYETLHGETCEESKEFTVINGYFSHIASNLVRIWKEEGIA